MRTTHLSYLIDPLTKQSFTLTIYDQQGEHVFFGLLLSASSWYPIINGIPRILVGEMKQDMLQRYSTLYEQYSAKLPPHIRQEWRKAQSYQPPSDNFLAHQEKTAQSFAYEWKNIYVENDYEKKNFFHFLSPYIYEEELQGKKTIDIGCGSGRFTKWAALSGTSISFGTDLGESVEVAYELTQHLPNTCIIQADIYNMPFNGIFDVAYSIGVLHHLPQPQQGFTRLPSVLKTGGKMLIWVYNRRHNARALYFYEPLRTLLRHLAKPMLYKLCYIPALGVHIINQATHLLNELGATTLARKVLFSYYANFPFNMKLNDAFDVLATPKSNYYYVEDIKNWFESAHLKNIQAYEHPEAGITSIGIHA